MSVRGNTENIGLFIKPGEVGGNITVGT